MRKSEKVGTKYDSDLDAKIDANQQSLVDDLTHPHSYKLDEDVHPAHKICASYPNYQVDAQPVQARGRIVWNKAYSFQPHGPSFLDPIPDQKAVPDAR